MATTFLASEPAKKVLQPESRVYSKIYPSIYGIYIAPLQGNYSETLPAQTRAKIKVLRSL